MATSVVSFTSLEDPPWYKGAKTDMKLFYCLLVDTTSMYTWWPPVVKFSHGTSPSGREGRRKGRGGCWANPVSSARSGAAGDPRTLPAPCRGNRRARTAQAMRARTCTSQPRGHAVKWAEQGQNLRATPCSLCNALNPAPNPRTRPPSIGAKADAGGFAAPTPACLHHTTNAQVPPSAHTVKIRNSWLFCTASHIVFALMTRIHRSCTMNPLSACMIGPAVGCTSEKVL